jgi:hypothetical protein
MTATKIPDRMVIRRFRVLLSALIKSSSLHDRVLGGSEAGENLPSDNAGPSMFLNWHGTFPPTIVLGPITPSDSMRDWRPRRGKFAMKELLLALSVCLVGAGCEKRDLLSTRNRTTMEKETEWVEPFFRDYGEAFRSKSKARLLAKFCLPLTFLTKTGPIVFQDEERLSANLDALLRRYEQIEAVDWKYTIKNIRALGAGIYLVEIEWQFFNAGNELLYACDTSYLLAAETPTGPKVMAVIAHNETERYEQALKRRKQP